MVTFTSNSVAETEAFAERFGRKAQPGWVLGLVGDLGAGKTQFVKGFSRGLGVQELVLSPTFALLHEYRSGRLPLFHLDFYRLQDVRQIRAAGLEEYLDPAEGVAIVEWWDRWKGQPPSRLIQFTFEALGDCVRRITYDDSRP